MGSVGSDLSSVRWMSCQMRDEHKKGKITDVDTVDVPHKHTWTPVPRVMRNFQHGT